MTSGENAARASDSTLAITDLPKDVLIVIFEHCDFQTLLSIAQVCRTFNALASENSLWRPILKKCVNGPSKKGSCSYSFKDYCRLSFNWVRGQYCETTLVDFHKRLLPWLQLSQSSLFISEENAIKTFNHRRGKKKASKPISSIVCGKDDVVKFVVKNNMLVSGSMGNMVSVWNIRDKPYSKLTTFFGHTKSVYCVDILGDIVISGSRDRSIKIWSLVLGRCVNTIQIDDPVRSIIVNPFTRTFAAGCAGYLKRHSPLRLNDLETGHQLCELCDGSKHGAGVVDMKFDSPYILLSCGYDTAVRLWDIRTNTRCCVKKWEDPHDSAIYCIDSDKKWMILSGTNRYGVVRMWDKRMDRSVKYYNISRHSTSPVYSLKFTQTKLFVALDSRVNILNFESR